MNKKTSALSIFSISAIFMALAMTLAVIFIYLGNFDFALSLWKNGTPVIIKWMPYAVVLVIALFSIALSYTEKQEGLSAPTPDRTHPATIATRVASALVAIGILSTVVAQFIALGSYDHLNLILSPSSEVYMPIVAVIHILSLVAAIPASLWFIYLALGKQPSVVLGMLTLVYLLLVTFRVYFDMSVLLSNPRWSWRVFTMLFALLFMLLETKLLITQKHYCLYRALSVISMAVLASSGISTLVLNITGHFHDGLSCFYYALDVTLAVYIAFRLFSISPEKPASQSNERDEEENAGEDSETAPEDTPEEPVCEAPADVPEDTPETPDTPSEADELPDLTPDEVKRLYKAIMLSIAKRHDLSEEPTAEEKRAVVEESQAVMRQLLATEDREERITTARAILAKSDF